MLALAIDTTTRVGGFALARDGEVVATRAAEPENGLAAVLFGEVEGLLADASCTLADVDVFAALAGPGSFTGIRVGLSAMKALGEANGKSVLAVSNLEALAYLGEGPVRAVVLAGRRGDVFGAIYSADLEPLAPERIEPAAVFFERALRLRASWTTTDAGLELPTGVEALVVGPLAEAAAHLACERQVGAPETADANYVERPAVEKTRPGA